MNNIIDNTITREDFNKSVKLHDLEVFTEAQVNAWVSDASELIQKSEKEELSDIEKSEIDNFKIDFASLKKVIVIEDDLSKSVVYCRPSQVEWDVDENGEIMKARSGVYKDTPINRKKGIVGMRYGSKKIKPEKEEKKKVDDNVKAFIDKQVNSVPENIKKDVREILESVAEHRTISDRVKALEKKGYFADEVRMGSGGVGQIKEMSDRYRVQIGYGHGRYNYAMAVEIPKTSSSK